MNRSNSPIEDGAALVAEALLQARRTQSRADASALEQALLGPDDAYRVQDLVARGLGESASPMAWKSGGVSRSAPLTHAALIASGVWASPADARSHPFHLRMIEAEVALRLGRDVTPQEAATLTHEDAPSLAEAMTVSIEIVDSRWQQGLAASALLRLADLQSHGALVLGEWIPFSPRDWAAQVCTVRIGHAAPQTFKGSYALGDPAWLLPLWLRHACRKGDTVRKGTVVTTGTWCGALEARAGDAVEVAFEGLGEARVQL